MPLTFSHPVAILPLRRLRGLDPVALAIGSMAPDFGYFVHAFRLAARAHSLAGTFTAALPGALGVWLLLRLLVRPLARPLPQAERDAVVAAVTQRGWRPADLASVVVSLVIGIVTHQVWDAFTHRTGWAVQRWTWLSEPWPLCRLLQYGCSAAGLAILGGLYLRWRRSRNLPWLPDWRREWPLPVLGALCALLTLPGAVATVASFQGLLWYRALAFTWIVHSCACFAAAYGVLGMILIATDRRGRSHP